MGNGRSVGAGRRTRFFIVVDAGFIGSHFCDALLTRPETRAVTVYDKFSSGQEWHVAQHLGDDRFKIVRGDVEDQAATSRAIAGHEVVIHVASGPDIARSASEPSIDFWQGTALTNAVLEAMRSAGVPEILYASGSGVYGDVGLTSIEENRSPTASISTYGASKLAGDVLIGSYCCMFSMRGLCIRFGNVVSSRQTHGVGYDFVRSLRDDAKRLRILGNGTQSKSYVAVTDVVAAVLHACESYDGLSRAFNVAMDDYITVTEIGRLACEVVSIDPAQVDVDYSGGSRGL